MIGDRFIFSRGDGYNPKMLFSLDREKAKEPYGAAIFQALTNGVIDSDTSISKKILDVKDAEAQLRVQQQKERKIQIISRKIDKNTTSVLDLPNVSDDFNCHSIALHGVKFAAVLQNECYFIPDLTSNNRAIKKVFKAKPQQGNLSSVEWLNNSALIVGLKTGHTILVDVTQKNVNRPLHAPEEVIFANITRIARLSDAAFFTGHDNGIVVYHDAQRATSKVAFDAQNNAYQICSITPSSDKRHVAVGMNDNAIYMFQRTTENTLSFVRTFLGMRGFAWLPQSNTSFVTGGGPDDPIVRLYSLKSDKPLKEYRMHDCIGNICFITERLFVVSAGKQLAHLYVAEKISKLQEQFLNDGESFLDVAYDQKGGLIASTSEETLKIWPAYPIEKKPLPDNKRALSKFLSIR